MAGGGNETLAARAFLETLALDGLLVSGDAMHAHAGRAEVILDRGGDYFLALQATLNLLNKARPKMSVARKRRRSGWSDAFARPIIGQMR